MHAERTQRLSGRRETETKRSTTSSYPHEALEALDLFYTYISYREEKSTETFGEKVYRVTR